jgi:hypothetical protein
MGVAVYAIGRRLRALCQPTLPAPLGGGVCLHDQSKTDVGSGGWQSPATFEE